MRKSLVCLGVLLSLMHPLVGFEGFYVGGSAGTNATIGRQTGDVVAQFSTTDPIFFPMDLSADLFNGNAEGSLYAGYGRQWQCLYGGLEGFVRYSHPHLTFHRQHLHDERPSLIFNRESSTELSVGPWHYGLDGRAGFLVNPCTLLYGRIGVEWALIKLDSDARFNGFVGSQIIDISLSTAQQKRSAYLRLGAGIEKQLNSCFSLKVDYLYTDYGSISVKDQTTGISSAGNFLALADSTQVHLKNHAVSLGLSYYFSQFQSCCFNGICKDPHFCGFYLAGALGGSIFDGKVHGDPRGEILGAFLNPIFLHASPSPHLVDTHFLSSLSFGYSYQWHRCYLGLEAFGLYSPHCRSLQDSHIFDLPAFLPRRFDVSFETQAEIDPWQFGINFRPGFMITPSTLLFGSIGTSSASIEAHSKGTGTFLNPDGSVTLLSSAKARRATLRVGGGIEYALSSCWHLRADYIYTDYGSLRLQGTAQSAGTPPDIFRLVEDTRVHLRTHDVTIGLARYF